MTEFEPLIGEWHGEGEVPMEPPMKISVEEKIERLGKFIVISSVGEPAEGPDSVSISGGPPPGGGPPADALLRRSRGQAAVHDGPRRLHLEDLACPRRGLEWPPRPRLQPALHRRDLG